MPFETTYKSDFYHIEIDQAHNLLRAEWLRPVNKDEIVAGGTKLQEALMDSGITRAVANAQRIGTLDADTKEWLSTTFYTLLSQTPLEKLARVLPSSLFSKLALEAVATRAEAQNIARFTFRNFNTQQEALDWLND